MVEARRIGRSMHRQISALEREESLVVVEGAVLVGFDLGDTRRLRVAGGGLKHEALEQEQADEVTEP